MTQILRHLLFALVLIWPFAHAGAAEDNHVKIRILAERGEIKPGEDLWIGIEQSIDPHWHTYWQNPGDSGAAPTIKWNLPEGFSMSEIHWPTPQKIAYPPLMNYGYENNVILLQKLSAPKTLPEGEINLSANIEILVCQDVCIPEYGSYNLTLNGPELGAAEANTIYLNAARTKLPQKVNWTSNFKETPAGFSLLITPSNPTFFDNLTPDMVELFPLDWGLVDNAAPATVSFQDNQIVITQKRGTRGLEDIKTATLVITRGKGVNRLSYEIQSQHNYIPAAETPTTPQDSPAPSTNISLLSALTLALLGGLILNLMPCVFPVLALKALSLVKIAEKHPNQAKIHGLSYTAGIILSFLVIAGILIGLQSTGAGLGWGFHLQNPLIVGTLAYLLFFIGLNLFGFFEFGNSFMNVGGTLTQGHGYKSSFFTGVLATLVATPCTAPFMAAAIGYALTQPPHINLSIFAALGLGLALPYLILSFSPKLERALPKPGPWMNTFKQFMAFPMFLSAAWLIWVLSQQSGSTAVLHILIGMVLITFALWIIHHLKHHQKLWLRILAIFAVIGAFLLLDVAPLQKAETEQPTETSWIQTYSAETLETALKTTNPVFVEMTAAWCITCKVNHATSINIDATKKLFAEQNVQYLLGDWTNQDAEITKYLNNYGRNGVPIYVFYGQPNETGQRPEPMVLPQVLTPGIIKNAIKGE